ncbi:hypothetical protein [uncultured Serinicoccus sp.]|uniref:hypothetical protein n=1 Tax=uncultured Serinicoccus sp. TaxID=735514 RepID=UPI002610388F|nr:hypothetical protein [uncultured Serinicoccus sp.]
METRPGTPDAGAVRTMVRVCRSRERAWGTLRRLTDAGDTGAWAERLEDDIARLGEAVAWLEADWRPDGVLLLEGLVRRARRRGVEDLAELAEDAAAAAQPHLSRLGRQVRTVHEQVRTELTAWEEGDVLTAKTLRVDQMGLVGTGSEVRGTLSTLTDARTPVWSPVAQVVGAYLLLETGH